jgi:RNA polymerase sigma-70 factor, ECF subfamily
MHVTPSPADVTVLLDRANAGDADAARTLLPLLYDGLRAVAGKQFRGQAGDHTLQPTVLVHEAFLRLVGKPANHWNDRRHFFAVAATAMRQILVNHARDRRAQKRGGGNRPVELQDGLVGHADAPLDVLDLNDALDKLKSADERKARVVELRFFAGLSVPEVADVLDVSVSTVEAEWRAARAFLATRLGSA